MLTVDQLHKYRICSRREDAIIVGAIFSPRVQNEFINCLHSSMLAGGLLSRTNYHYGLPHSHPNTIFGRRQAMPRYYQVNELCSGMQLVEWKYALIGSRRVSGYILIVIIPKYHPCDLPPMLTVDQRHKYRICSGREDAAPPWLPGARFSLVFGMSSLTVYTPRWLADFSFMYNHPH
ncbi:hypothetical protein CEXT_431061 [Caerostris extrusa]|uniref:Uncharacterized protein n=1 Tax=Caerostris extrusa TaxID=172846 RepID=A0AAV4PPY8_CAEEX|nr:hypothetical protein CEXT_431061 [Caerostris extrusa]